MKNALTLITLLFISGIGLSQDNWKPADSAASWTGRHLVIMGPAISYSDWTQFYVPESDYDTLIGGKTYSKLYENTGEDTVYFCSYRSDTIEKAVYIVPADSTSEFIHFDFDDFDVGDTVTIGLFYNTSFWYHEFKIDGLDSVMIESEYYKSWSLDGEYVYAVITERIMSRVSLPFNIESDVTVSGLTMPQLRCYAENGSPVFPSTSCSYPYYSNTIDVDENILQLRLYPNPVKNQLKVEFPSDHGTFEILDLNGRVLLNKRISNSAYTFDLSGFESGTYIYQFQSDSFHTTGKLIKQ